MANHRATEARVLMRVPKRVKNNILELARKDGVPATTFLETCIITSGMEDETTAINAME